MKRGLFFRSFVVTATMFAVCFIVFGMTMIVMGRMFLVHERQESLYASANEVTLLAEAVNRDDGLGSLELRMSLAVISKCSGNHILLSDTDGVIFTSSDNTRVSPYQGMQIAPAVLEQLASQGEYRGLDTLGGIYGAERYIVARTIRDTDGQPAGYAFITCEAGTFLATWSGFVIAYVVVAVGVLALAVCFQFLYSRRISRPLTEMAEAANRFARGDYSARIGRYDEEDEIGTLIDAFNGMAESVQRNDERRREFVANVSHELRTPMTSIAGFADGLLDGTIPPSEEKKYLATISSETKRLSRLVRSMLDISRLRDGDASARQGRFGLSEMVVQTVLNFEDRVAKKKLSMELHLPEDELYVRGDVDSLTRVVYNLVDNAVKFADEGTPLTVSVWKENGRAYTCVQDVGMTIPRSELPVIFDRFHKADKSRSRDPDGVGLGLNMVREIVAAHDQDIFVTSEDGVTAFTFTLALADEEPQRTNMRPARAGGEEGAKI